MNDQRAHDLARFYELLNRLEDKLGGARRLSECNGKMGWPPRGVYFFREAGECRRETGEGPRIVRVGTHALKAGSKTTLWKRLSQHKGVVNTGGGNHRGSIFRSLVGAALIKKNRYDEYPKWGKGSSASKEVGESEHPLEQAVSVVIGDMPFLWLEVDDKSGPNSCRGYIECNAIALLSNHHREPLDLPSEQWLGYYSDREKVRQSGLWNNNYVGDVYNPAFLDCLERLIG